MWQRFTERARTVVFYAQEEAQRHGVGYVATEHLLLGLLRERDSVAMRVIQSFGVSPVDIQTRVEELMPSDDQRSKHGMTLTPRGKLVIDLAYDEARNLGNNFIGTEHLLLGLVREGEGLAGRVLERLGIALDPARREVMKVQDNAPQGPSLRRADQEWVKPVGLEGSVVRLEPLSLKHAADLAEACDEHMFDFFPTYPASFDQCGLEQYILKRNAMPLTVAYAIIDKASGKAIGSSSFFDIRPDDKGLEIGHTWIMKEHRGTKVNPETKLLMFGHAFETLGAIRVQQKTDLRNMQSQRAMLKMGCKQEGVLRHNMVMPDGYVRDSVFFSVLCEEWPAVKQGLIERLKA